MTYGFSDILQLLGALGLFLFGMKVMSDALMNLAGDNMRKILARMTSNRLFGIFTGFLITSIIQSSSATTLMVVSFANASLLTLAESISVIMGANIGTTITAWLITILGFKVSMSTIALPLVGLGFGITFFKKKNSLNWGNFIIGFAILFIGLQFLKDAVPDIKNNPEILAFLTSYTDMGYISVLLFMLIGTVLTVVIQSSSATMALTLIMTAQGWIPFELAAAMVLGENIGTTITANLAATVANFHAKRTARAHLIFNIIGVIWVLLLFYPVLNLIDYFVLNLENDSPYSNALVIPVAISLFHTCFNISNTLLLVWFIKPIARFVERLIPEKIAEEKEIDEPKYLAEGILKYPETFIKGILFETKYLFKNAVFEIVAHGLNLHREDIKSDLKIKKLVKASSEDMNVDIEELYYAKVKNIYGEIIRYATTGQKELNLSKQQFSKTVDIKLANRKMVEIIKNIRELNKNVMSGIEKDNKHLTKEYDSFRRKMMKVLRTIYLFRTVDDTIRHAEKLLELKQEAKDNIRHGSKSIDKLIRKDLITAEMASSLFNDFINLNDSIKKLIEVTELLYEHKDTLLEYQELKSKKKSA